MVAYIIHKLKGQSKKLMEYLRIDYTLPNERLEYHPTTRLGSY
jgi:hypothetical protein